MSVIFLNRQNGLVNFFALSGPFIGRVISVRYLSATWHYQARLEGRFKHLTSDQFENDIIGSIGIVHSNGEPLSAGIVFRVNQQLAVDRHSNGHNVVSDLCTGVRNPMGTWRRFTLLEQFQLFPTHDALEVLADDIRVEGLLASSFPPIMSTMRT